jgi:CubicO group peptidase (beta-lactamase class C family)
VVPPNVRPVYSNVGFGLLGRLLEGPAGTAWEDYLSANVLKPLGMTNTGFAPPTDMTYMGMY